MTIVYVACSFLYGETWQRQKGKFVHLCIHKLIFAPHLLIFIFKKLCISIDISLFIISYLLCPSKAQSPTLSPQKKLNAKSKLFTKDDTDEQNYMYMLLEWMRPLQMREVM